MSIKIIEPKNFESVNHFYSKVLNAHVHPLVRFFINLGNERIIERYCHLHPEVNKEKLKEILNYKSNYFKWSGADLFPVTTGDGIRQMILIETNSCPSGMKSMPILEEGQEYGGYKRLIETAFLPLLKSKKGIAGDLAVIFDKNEMEASGYAHVMADLMNENVYLVKMNDNLELNSYVKFENGILLIRPDESNDWVQIRAAFRYVTQRPWNRIPVTTKTIIFNPIIACLSGGRNKLIANKAYDMLNGELQDFGLRIRVPETLMDLSKNELELWVKKMGGFAVIKNPYSNAGQGVWTITNNEEMENFKGLEQKYDKFILQSLIGNASWSSTTKEGKYYHVGTVPDKKGNIFVADLRMMICNGPDGFKPLAVYARKAKNSLPNKLDASMNSWEILGTNLSIKKDTNQWDSDTNRLLLMDQRDFNKIGIGLDDLIEGYIQTVLASVAINKMAQQLMTLKKKFRMKLFTSLVADKSLINEIVID